MVRVQEERECARYTAPGGPCRVPEAPRAALHTLHKGGAGSARREHLAHKGSVRLSVCLFARKSFLTCVSPLTVTIDLGMQPRNSSGPSSVHKSRRPLCSCTKRRRTTRSQEASFSPTPSLSSGSFRRHRAEKSSSSWTRPSRRTRRATGPQRSTSREARSRASTSSTCEIG